MSIRKNDDVVFSFVASIEDSAAFNGAIKWVRVRTQAGRTKYFCPEDFHHLSIDLLAWEPTEDRARISFAARVVMPIYKDGSLVALVVEGKRGKQATVRFREYGDLLFSNLSDEVEQSA